ncbi:hypothetical protein [Winogradskyella sp. UBA3174]|uniref:hypothetical protein n=1 Tax=Winogradskyella sp. UBA3174 TaxID=1947785 RepID=UPI0025F5A38F|nr:hypothetical protein [Winogradskyella sp. UBA3174]
MKKLFLVLISVLLFGCNKTEINNNCIFLLDINFTTTINLNLPQFNQLLFPSNAVRIEGFGNEGIILYRLNSATLLAWDGADPNHIPSACSELTVESGSIIATCGCEDGNAYNLATGTFSGDNPLLCTLKPYRVEAIGNNNFLISN